MCSDTCLQKVLITHSCAEWRRTLLKIFGFCKGNKNYRQYQYDKENIQCVRPIKCGRNSGSRLALLVFWAVQSLAPCPRYI
jgi:hypothetical protein